jgi:cytochrome c553
MAKIFVGAARAASLIGAIAIASSSASTVRADSATGAAIAENGVPTVPPCSACHGDAGAGVDGVAPRLAGLSKAYLVNQLAEFRSGSRQNPVMQPVAVGLTPAQSEDVADYYSAITAPSQPASAAGSLVSAGSQIAEHGIASVGLPACDTCHGPDGIGVAPDAPYLAGRDAGYIERQIASWRVNRRGGDPQGLMTFVTSKLSDQDVVAVASYFASLPAPRRQGEK